MSFYDNQDQVRQFASFVRSKYNHFSQSVVDCVVKKYATYWFAYEQLNLHNTLHLYPSNEFCVHKLIGLSYNINNKTYQDDCETWQILSDNMKAMQKMFDEAQAKWYEDYQVSVKHKTMLGLAMILIVIILALLSMARVMLAISVFVYLIALLHDFESTIHNTVYFISKIQVWWNNWWSDEDDSEFGEMEGLENFD